MNTVVIDIYHGDKVFNFDLKPHGIVGVIHKCTEGTNVSDSLYAHRRRPFTDAGLAWGAYHFFHGDGKAEADYFLSHAEADGSTLLALDWETTLGGYTPSASQARAFLERIIEKVGRRAVLYSGHAAKEKINGKDPFFSSHKLWLADYNAHWHTQQSWDYPWLWQYRGDASFPGLERCDLNTIVRGTTAGLLSEWGAGVTPPSPPSPPTLLSGKGSWYSQYSGKYKWGDMGDRPGSAALGVPDDAQGVAFYDTASLGKWFEIHYPNGYISVEQQTDIGPAIRTGRKIDISAAAAERAGYAPSTFPTDAVFKWKEVPAPASVADLSPRVAAIRYRDLRVATAREE